MQVLGLTFSGRAWRFPLERERSHEIADTLNIVHVEDEMRGRKARVLSVH
jgi:hypothetical protein